MGYIQIFGERLAQMLSELPEDERRVIIRFIKDELLRSYKNGLRDAKDFDDSTDDKRPAHHHRPKTSSR